MRKKSWSLNRHRKRIWKYKFIYLKKSQWTRENFFTIIKIICKTSTAKVILYSENWMQSPEDQEQGKDVYSYHLYSSLYWRPQSIQLRKEKEVRDIYRGAAAGGELYTGKENVKCMNNMIEQYVNKLKESTKKLLELICTYNSHRIHGQYKKNQLHFYILVMNN